MASLLGSALAPVPPELAGTACSCCYRPADCRDERTGALLCNICAATLPRLVAPARSQP